MKTLLGLFVAICVALPAYGQQCINGVCAPIQRSAQYSIMPIQQAVETSDLVYQPGVYRVVSNYQNGIVPTAYIDELNSTACPCNCPNCTCNQSGGQNCQVRTIDPNAYRLSQPGAPAGYYYLGVERTRVRVAPRAGLFFGGRPRLFQGGCLGGRLFGGACR